MLCGCIYLAKEVVDKILIGEMRIFPWRWAFDKYLWAFKSLLFLSHAIWLIYPWHTYAHLFHVQPWVLLIIPITRLILYMCHDGPHNLHMYPTFNVQPCLLQIIELSVAFLMHPYIPMNIDTILSIVNYVFHIITLIVTFWEIITSGVFTFTKKWVSFSDKYMAY